MKRQIKVSIVENDPIYANLLEARLQAIGYMVISKFTTGKEAIEQLPEALPDMMVVDVNIPGAPGGIETAEEIFLHYNIPSVFLTDSSDSVIFERVKQVPGAGCVQKPFRDNDFRIAIGLGLANFGELRKVREMGALASRVLENIPAETVVPVTVSPVTGPLEDEVGTVQPKMLETTSGDDTGSEEAPNEQPGGKPPEEPAGTGPLEIIAVTVKDEFRVCPKCGYERGFHSTLVSRNPNADGLTRFTKVLYRVVLVCPECGARYDVGWRVSLIEQEIQFVTALNKQPEKPA